MATAAPCPLPLDHTVPEKAETRQRSPRARRPEMEAMLLALAEDPAAQSGSRTVLKYLLALASRGGGFCAR
jgi:hypothetical protein